MTASLSPLPRSVSVEIVSPARREEASVAVVVPTFRRPDFLLRTLDSLSRQFTTRHVVVVLVENDSEGRAGLEAARSRFESGLLPGLAVVAHERGNCSAYNAGFAAARRFLPKLQFVLVIDDDEEAEPGWIETLIETADRLRVDVVGGPQIPVFEQSDMDHLATHPVFRPAYERTGEVPVLVSSGNVLIRARVLEAMGEPALDTRFNFTGGGDADFFSRCRQKGFRFGWCREAAVRETVPARRTEFSWINARALRNGALSTLVQRGRDGRARTLAKSLALAVASPPRSAMLAWRSRSLTVGLYHMQIALGRLQGELGLVGEQYRKPESN